MATKMDIKQRQCITPEFRVSFPNVFEKRGYKDKEPKYSITMLFDKKKDLSAMKKAVTNALVAKWGSKDNWPKKLILPFRSGDEKSDLKGYAGAIIVNANSKFKSQVISAKKNPETGEYDSLDDESFYAGCYARATLTAEAFDVDGGRGVKFHLGNLQKLRDGEPFSGRRDASEEFEEVEDSSDDLSSYDDMSSSDEEMDEASIGF